MAFRPAGVRGKERPAALPGPLSTNFERADAASLVNLRAAWKAWQLTVQGELLNVFNSPAKDIEYLYGCNVTGLDSPGVTVDGRLSQPSEPLTLRVGLKYEF